MKQTHWGVYLIIHTDLLSNQQWSFPTGVFKFILSPVNKSVFQYRTYNVLGVNDMGVLERLMHPRKAIDCLSSCSTGSTMEKSRVDMSKSLLRQTNKASLYPEARVHFQGP